jgi:hypothetical protein
VEDFELYIDGEKKPIVEFHGKQRSIRGTREGRQFALSFDVTGYGNPLADAVSHFVHHTLTPSDQLLVRSPIHIYKLNPTADKEEIIKYIDANLEKDILQYKNNKTTAVNTLTRLIKNLETKIDKKKVGIRSILLFINQYSSEWKNFYALALTANLENYSELASRMSSEDQNAEKWLIHFQENDREMTPIPEQYQKISAKIKKYVSANAKNFGDDAALITETLDKIEKSMHFPGELPIKEMLNDLLGTNLNCTVFFLNSRNGGKEHGYEKTLQDICQATGGISIYTENPAEGLDAMNKHVDFYYELIFKFDGDPADKNIQVTLPGFSGTGNVHLYYKKKFKKEEFRWLMDYLADKEKEIAISGYSLENYRLNFTVSGFELSRSGEQPGQGIIKVTVHLINDKQETVYETGKTLKAAGTSVSISLDLPDRYKGYFKLSITAGDIISGKSFELKEYVKL